MEVRRLSLHLSWLVAALALLTVLGTWQMLASQQAQSGAPFGVFSWDEPDSPIAIVDFPTHLNFTRHFWAGEPPRPYTMEAQQAMVRAWVPNAGHGMPFAYSPVAVLLAAPMTLLPTGLAYLLWGLANAAAATLVWRCYLAPRVRDLPGLILALAGTLSLSFFSTLIIGQTSILTTVAIAGIWALLWDFARQEWRPLELRGSLLAGGLLFLVASKPSVAIAAGFLLLGARAWRALGVAAALCLATSLAMSPVLGGFPQWIGDYVALLGGYNQEQIGDFMRPGIPPQILTSLLGFLDQAGPGSPARNAAVCQVLWLGGSLLLCGLVLTRRLPPGAYFRLTLVWFLIFCPHVSATEDWLLVLAVVEPRAWPPRVAPRHRLWLLEAALLVVAVNFRQGVPFENLALAPALVAKFGLLLLWVGETFRRPRPAT
ncbi:MAG: glycosyltransferase family 87 protein [Verrucomicrobiota bacterium]